MTKANGKSHTQAGKLAVPINHNETGNPMARAAARA
jgi:hypothetical protein